MKRYFPFLALIIFLFFINETRSQNPLLDSLPEKVEKKIIFNPNFSFSSFLALLQTRTAQDDTRIIDVGIRSTFYLQKPDFVFLYLDLFGDYFQSKTKVTFGKPDVFTEKSFLAECGIGFSGGFKISKRISIDGEITFPFNQPPYPTITTSFNWTSKSEKFFIGAGNIVMTGKPGIGNLLFYTGINISK